MVHLPDTHYQKYPLQTSIYNLMLQNVHGIDVGDRTEWRALIKQWTRESGDLPNLKAPSMYLTD